MYIHKHVNVCVYIYICIHIFIVLYTRLFFPFSGQPCISDDEEVKEIDLPELESDSGCPQPVPPENAFIRVSILTFTLGLESKKIELKRHALSFI